ncbi:MULTISPECIES: argininosuccinate synthase domain-containing protein [unclassified Pseudomonas]|uniref:argininosuccinate synthase domain-containing protein n=1 Tax=unclassified Pseudomonas TaxID=196821 RepID=UPI0030D882F0
MKISELKNRKVGVCSSGGLVSLFISQLLENEQIDFEQFIVDIGQPNEEAHQFCTRNIDLLNAAHVVDLKEDMATECLNAVRAQAHYDGGYWNTTGIARAVTVKGLVAALGAKGCNVLAHGAVHGGNDEFRFTYYLNMFAPHIMPYSPWQDSATAERFKTRSDMGRAVIDKNEQLLRDKAAHSIDANLGGVSHESVELESIANSPDSVQPIMGVRPEQAPDQVERCTIRFAKGYPVEINGKVLSHYEAVAMANEIAGRNGVVIKAVLENRMNGTKGRGTYESPGLDLIATALKSLYQATVDKDSWEVLRFSSTFIARQTYAGRLYDPATQAAFKAVSELVQWADGYVDVKLYKGSYLVDRVYNYSRNRFTAQQYRFAHGGQRWITENILESA